MEECAPDTYRLLASPGLVLGLAAGDTIRIARAHDFDVVTRGGNLCVQVFRSGGVDQIERFASEVTSRLRGRLDGKSPQQLVYTIPVTAGFQAVERVLNEVVQRFPDTEWYYGNVYDPSDGVTPLNWWNSV